MSTPDPLRRVLATSRWWVVRGESGTLWKAQFQPEGVIAQGKGIPPFDIESGLDTRCRAMAGIPSDFQKEMNDFIDEMDDGHAIVLPDEGGRAAHFGVVASPPFVSSYPHWLSRRCDWEQALIPLVAGAQLNALGPRYTVFDETRRADAFRTSILAALAERNRRP